MKYLNKSLVLLAGCISALTLTSAAQAGEHWRVSLNVPIVVASTPDVRYVDYAPVSTVYRSYPVYEVVPRGAWHSRQSRHHPAFHKWHHGHSEHSEHRHH